MGNQIILIDPETGKPQTTKPVSFAGLGVHERRDLEEWIKTNPDILGNRLLIVTTEYDKFDKSDKRLDLLALDEEGKLVVVELKRDASRTLADLQAIRYAAFCSSLTFDSVVQLRAGYAKVGEDAAKREIREFVEDPGFSILDKKPRIILAAGSIEDQELTSCVLWLREFGFDIRCVEITPYRIGDSGRLVLVPRVIIPLPRSEAYIVRAEKKESAQGTDTLTRTKNLQGQFWSAFVRYCEERGAIPELIGTPHAAAGYPISLGCPGIFLELKIITQPALMSCQLVVQNSESASTYQHIEKEKAAIENEVKASLEWIRPLADGKRGRIVQTRPAELESQQSWTDYFEWLRGRAEAFYRTFLPRLRSTRLESENSK
jgi:Domain of unknown function (DUF4268)